MRPTHYVIIGIFGFAAYEKIRGILTIIGGPDDGRTIATRHGSRWLLPDGKPAQVKESRPRLESQIGASSVRTWPVIGVGEQDQPVLVEVLERWNPATQRWEASGDNEYRMAIPQRGQRQDRCLQYGKDGKPLIWWKPYLGRWTRDHSSDPGKGWREKKWGQKRTTKPARVTARLLDKPRKEA